MGDVQRCRSFCREEKKRASSLEFAASRLLSRIFCLKLSCLILPDILFDLNSSEKPRDWDMCENRFPASASEVSIFGRNLQLRRERWCLSSSSGGGSQKSCKRFVTTRLDEWGSPKWCALLCGSQEKKLN